MGKNYLIVVFFVLLILVLNIVGVREIKNFARKRQVFTTRLYTGMGTQIEITLPENYQEYADRINGIIQILDSLYHPFHKGSDIVKLNTNSGKWVKVSPFTAFCIDRALKVSQITNGAFDITIGKLVHLWNFEHIDSFKIPSDSLIKIFKKFVDFRKVQVKGNSVKVGEGQEITISGIAKGCALDIIKDSLMFWGIPQALVNIGGEILGYGNRRWRIGIRDPEKPGIYKVIELQNRFIATSGNYERFIKRGGKIYTHIFNPLTGQALTYRVLSVSVIADSGWMADGLATAFSILPDRQIKRLAESLNLELVIIRDSDTLELIK